MITCHIRYQIDPDEITAFEEYARRWIDLLPRFGGTHHVNFVPSESESGVALAMFSFPNLAAHARYREEAASDAEVAAVNRIASGAKCFRRYERSFFKSLLPA